MKLKLSEMLVSYTISISMLYLDNISETSTNFDLSPFMFHVATTKLSIT